MIISEYINIFKIIRTPFIYEFIKYFKNIDEKFNKQNIETSEEDLIEKRNNLIKLFKFSYTDEMFENMK